MKIKLHVSSRKQFTDSFGRVAGTTYQQGVPISARIKIMSRHNLNGLADLKSDSSGAYSIYLPRFAKYTIFSLSPSGKFNAVIQDNVVPK